MNPVLYCVTGFLGSGKTTFVKKLISRLKNRRLCVIVNEFGLTGVDGSLLKGLSAQVSEINNGSVFCSCRADQFEAAMRRAVEAEVEVIILEASGLSDPGGMNAMLYGVKLMGNICVVDAARFERIFSMVRVCREQAAAADVILINKIDKVSQDTLNRIHAILDADCPQAQVYETQYAEFDMEWLPTVGVSRDGRPHLRDVSLRKAAITLNADISLAQLTEITPILAKHTFRLKGFVVIDGLKYLVDCVEDEVAITLYAGDINAPGTLNALAGAGMPMQKSLKEAQVNWPGIILEVT